MLRKKWKVAATAALAACTLSTAFAGGADTTPAGNLHPLLFPTAASLFAPVGFGTDLGTFFGNFGWVNRWPGTTASDGYLNFGAGLGNGDKYVGLQGTVLLDSVSGDNNSNFAANGSFGFKLFRWLSPNLSIAAGVANVGRWGALKQDANSWYGSMTDYFSFFQDGRFPIAATFGFGSGVFDSFASFRANSDANMKPFGSLAVSLIPQLSVIADYTTDIWSTGLSLVPYLPLPLAVTGYATNLGGGGKQAGPVTYGVRVSIGYAFV
ncbi:MAG: hypothetical protein P1U34_04425 [Coxiellaceae bacterium]|nr:hypothetical protein [Coxiellaceae bacterium]